MHRFLHIFIPVVIFLASFHLDAQTQDMPPWILLEKGKAAYETRNIAMASSLILEAVEAVDFFPEAEYWLGKIYAAQGQNALAEEQYRRALDQALYLRVPEERYLITYELVNILLNQGPDRREEAENLLVEMTIADGAADIDQIQVDHLYVETFVRGGLDEFVYLYRNELSHALRAYRILGQMAWEDGRYRSSLLYALRVVLSMLSTVANRYLEYDPEWRFDIDVVENAKFPDRDVRYEGVTDGTSLLLELCELHVPAVTQWLQASGFWSQVYLLSVSLYAEGYTQSARDLWLFMTTRDPVSDDLLPLEQAGRWGLLAIEQLRSPFITTGSLDP